MRRASISWLLVAAAGGAAAAASGCGNSGSSTLTPDAGREVMIAPETCGKCHQQHFDEWSQSMHAKAADDPVFLAMNARGQRETNGKLGKFCVQCHAPLALSEGKTTNGLNLPLVAPQYKGVTCFFCHSIDGVEADGGQSNASVHVSDDLVMRGEISDPVPNSVHASKISPFQSSDRRESAEMCGYCHDIDSPAGGHIERTFAEWSASAFSSPGGSTCSVSGTCHMRTTPDVAIADGGKTNRTFHSHVFPAVDVPLKPPDSQSVQLVKDALNNNALQGALCVTEHFPYGIRVILDTAGVAHHWPSGAAQDRRAWTEVIAYDTSGAVLYSSGVVSASESVTDIGGNGPGKDPDLWLFRDCMFDAQKKETHNFWEAAETSGFELPALVTFDSSDPRFFQNHIIRAFPTVSPAYPMGALATKPARVTLRVLIQPVGLDVLRDLVDSGDLDPGPDGALFANMPTFEVSLRNLADPNAGSPGGLEWTPDANDAMIPVTELSGEANCKVTLGFNPMGDTFAGSTAATCAP